MDEQPNATALLCMTDLVYAPMREPLPFGINLAELRLVGSIWIDALWIKAEIWKSYSALIFKIRDSNAKFDPVKEGR